MRRVKDVHLSDSRQIKGIIQCLTFGLPSVLSNKSILLVGFHSNVINPQASPYRLIRNQNVFTVSPSGTCSILRDLPPEQAESQRSLGHKIWPGNEFHPHSAPSPNPSNLTPLVSLSFSHTQFMSVHVIISDFSLDHNE